MKAGKILVLIILLNGLIDVAIKLNNLHVPNIIAHFSLNPPELGSNLFELLHYLSIILTVIGAVRLAKSGTLEMLNIFKFPLYFFVTFQLFRLFGSGLSTENSFLFAPSEAAWYGTPIYCYWAIAFGFIIYHQLANVKPATADKFEPVPLGSRFLNRLIDGLFVTTLTFNTVNMLRGGWIFQNVEFFNSNPYWLMIICMFLYYFTLELLFMQTVGKLHNNSFVYYEEERLKSILGRTLCRFIPFEAFSFFSKKGWHDSIPRTGVGILTPTPPGSPSKEVGK